MLHTILAVFAVALTAQGADDKKAETPANETASAGDTAAPAAETDAAKEGEEAEEKEQAAEAEENDETGVGVIRAKMKKLEEAFAQLHKPNRFAISQHDKALEEAKNKLKSIEESQKKLDELKVRKENAISADYAFGVMPVENRDKYEREGGEMATKVASALKGKSEAERLTGLAQFEKLRETYQGLPQFKDVRALYLKTVNAFDKKWTGFAERLKKDRQKSANTNGRNDKLLELEERQYEKLARKMEAAGGNIDEDFFLPVPTNARMLEKALARLKRSSQNSLNKVQENVEDVVTLFKEYWTQMDTARERMLAGEYAEVLTILNESEPSQALCSVSHYVMPQEYKELIRKQNEELRNEVRRRQNELQNIEREEGREKNVIGRELTSITLRLDRAIESLVEEKALEVRREEEAAAEAAEEEARLAAEAAEAADDQEDEPAKPKKKSKKKKAKKAE